MAIEKTRQVGRYCALVVVTACLACGDADETETGTGALSTISENQTPPTALDRREQLNERRAKLFAGIGLDSDQQRSVDNLAAAKKAWKKENAAELSALRDEISAAIRAQDEDALDIARTQFRVLQETMPSLRGLVEDLSEEQRAKLDENMEAARQKRNPGDSLSEQKLALRAAKRKDSLAQRREQRFEGVGLTDEQQRNLEGLSEARRAWRAEHREELDVLRAERRAAEASGDVTAAAAVRARIDSLRATRPAMNQMLGDLTDEQLARFRKNEIKRRPAAERASKAALDKLMGDGADS